MASHDLQEPLRKIHTFGERLKATTTTLSPESRDYLERMQGAVLARGQTGNQTTFNVRLDDLLRDGDIRANVPVLPGDVVIIPQSWF